MTAAHSAVLHSAKLLLTRAAFALFDSRLRFKASQFAVCGAMCTMAGMSNMAALQASGAGYGCKRIEHRSNQALVSKLPVHAQSALCATDVCQQHISALQAYIDCRYTAPSWPLRLRLQAGLHAAWVSPNGLASSEVMF